MADAPMFDLGGLERDLARSFLPAWAREGGQPASGPRFEERERGDERPGKPLRGSPVGGKGRRERGARPEPKPAARRETPALAGWVVVFRVDERGLDGMAREIRGSGKAFGLFDLARFVLQDPARHLVELRREDSPGPGPVPDLFQLAADGSLWPSRREAESHAVRRCTETFYRAESVAVDPPKGNFPVIARCGLSGEILGPPNHHEYGARLRALHAAKFPKMSFEAFRARIEMHRDEETLAEWIRQQSTRAVYRPIDAGSATPDPARDPAAAAEPSDDRGEAPPGPPALQSLEEALDDFRSRLSASAITAVGTAVVVPGAAVARSAPSVAALVGEARERIGRFPLPFATEIGQQLAARGLQVFKSPWKTLAVAAVRPRPIDVSAPELSEGIRGILRTLATVGKRPRPEQWKALVGDKAGEALAAIASDLRWLIGQGHVVDYAARGFSVVTREGGRMVPESGRTSPEAEAPPGPDV